MRCVIQFCMSLSFNKAFDLSVLALDLGSSLGWASKPRNSNCIELGTEKFPLVKENSNSDGFRFLGFFYFLQNMHIRLNAIDIIAFENVHPMAFKSNRQSLLNPGFRATLLLWAAQRAVRVEPFGVNTIKKAVTGSGKAKKDEVIASIEKLGLSPDNDNEADAAAVFYALNNKLESSNE